MRRIIVMHPMIYDISLSDILYIMFIKYNISYIVSRDI